MSSLFAEKAATISFQLDSGRVQPHLQSKYDWVIENVINNPPTIANVLKLRARRKELLMQVPKDHPVPPTELVPEKSARDDGPPAVLLHQKEKSNRIRWKSEVVAQLKQLLRSNIDMPFGNIFEPLKATFDIYGITSDQVRNKVYRIKRELLRASSSDEKSPNGQPLQGMKRGRSSESEEDPVSGAS